MIIILGCFWIGNEWLLEWLDFGGCRGNDDGDGDEELIKSYSSFLIGSTNISYVLFRCAIVLACLGFEC